MLYTPFTTTLTKYHINVKETDIGPTMIVENSDWNCHLQWKHIYCLSIYDSKHNLQTSCQERRMVTAMTMNDSNWDFHLQWKSIDLKQYFRRFHGCTALKVL